MSLANTAEGIDPSEKNSKVKSKEDPQFKTDSTEVTEQPKSYNPEEAEFGSYNTTSNTVDAEGEMKEAKPSSQSDVSPSDNYYNDEEGEESSQSMISFNFLYYLLQKFKLSNSLGY